MRCTNCHPTLSSSSSTAVLYSAYIFLRFVSLVSSALATANNFCKIASRNVLWGIAPSVQGTSAQAFERIVGYSRPEARGRNPASNGLNNDSSRCLYVVFVGVWAARDMKGDNNARMGTGTGESEADTAFSNSSRYISARWKVRPAGTRTSAGLE